MDNKALLLSIIKDTKLLPSFSFIIWSDTLEIKKVSDDFNKTIISGQYFVMDTLSYKLENDLITQLEVTEDYEELKESFYDYLLENDLSKENLDYPILLSLLKCRINFLPFLNDTPYFPEKNILKVDKITDKMLVCTVVMKSRLHYKYNSGFYFQAIVETENSFCKIDFWGSAAKLHSSLELSSQIAIVKSKKIAKSYSSQLLYNTFYEEMYYNFNSYKVSETKSVLLVGEDYFCNKNELVKLEKWIKEGTKDDCEIHLYENGEKENNSEESEYKLQVKRTKRELKLPVTCISNTLTGTITYISTLKKIRTSYKDYNIKSINEQKKSKVYEYFLLRVNDCCVILFNNSQEQFYKLKPGKQVLLENLRCYKRGNTEMYMSSLYTSIRFYGEEPGSHIRNGIGFIPDNFLSFEESQETKEELINNEVVTILPLYKPIEAFLDINLETLVINETRKYFFREVFLKSTTEKSECKYFKGKEDVSDIIDLYILEKNDVQRYVFNVYNHFTKSKKEIKEGKCDVIVDCMRISQNDVFICISEVFYL